MHRKYLNIKNNSVRKSYLCVSIIGRRTTISSQNNSRISWAAIIFSSRIICSTWIQKQIYLRQQKVPGFSILNWSNALQEVTHTRMRAVASCPVSRSLAMSRRICLSWISLRFLSSFIRGIVNLSSVLLYTKAQITIIIINKKPKGVIVFIKNRNSEISNRSTKAMTDKIQWKIREKWKRKMRINRWDTIGQPWSPCWRRS